MYSDWELPEPLPLPEPPPRPVMLVGSKAHNSRPYNSNWATKKTFVPKTSQVFGTELPLPGLMSRIMNVPDSVPSLCHGSAPWMPSFAMKKIVLPKAWNCWIPLPFVAHGLLVSLPFQISLTITVPDSVPSLFHSSIPWVPSSARNIRCSPTAVINV